MKESKGGRAKSTKVATVQCTICGMDMDCPELMLSADRHFCARCTDLLAEGYEPEELKMSPEDIARHFARCDEVAEEMTDITFNIYWEELQETGIEHFNNEALAREFYIQGASTMLSLLISQGMPPPMLDYLEEAIRGAKRRMEGGRERRKEK